MPQMLTSDRENEEIDNASVSLIPDVEAFLDGLPEQADVRALRAEGEAIAGKL
jgi:hypothetical protein